MPLIAIQRQATADFVKGLGNFVGIARAAQGDTATPTQEASYTTGNRVASTLTSGSGGSVTGSAVVLNVAAATYTHGFLASAATGNNLISHSALSPSIVLNANGQAVITPSITVT